MCVTRLSSATARLSSPDAMADTNRSYRVLTGVCALLAIVLDVVALLTPAWATYISADVNLSIFTASGNTEVRVGFVRDLILKSSHPVGV